MVSRVGVRTQSSSGSSGGFGEPVCFVFFPKKIGPPKYFDRNSMTVPGASAQCPVPGARCRCPVLGAQCQCPVPGARCQCPMTVPGAGARCPCPVPVPGARCQCPMLVPGRCQHVACWWHLGPVGRKSQASAGGGVVGCV